MIYSSYSELSLFSLSLMFWINTENGSFAVNSVLKRSISSSMKPKSLSFAITTLEECALASKPHPKEPERIWTYLNEFSFTSGLIPPKVLLFNPSSNLLMVNRSPDSSIIGIPNSGSSSFLPLRKILSGFPAECWLVMVLCSPFFWPPLESEESYWSVNFSAKETSLPFISWI